MGIRPSLKLICGISNLKVKKGLIVDRRYAHRNAKGLDNHDWAETTIGKLSKGINIEKPEGKMTFRKEMEYEDKNRFIKANKKKTVEELIIWDAENGVPSVIGITVDEIPYASEIIYGFASVFPKMQQSGFRVIPSVKRLGGSAATIAYSSILENPKVSEEEKAKLLSDLDDEAKDSLMALRDRRKNNQNYMFFNSYEFDLYATQAKTLFDLIGLKVDKSELRLILYWKWS